jgi:hypothetical protein
VAQLHQFNLSYDAAEDRLLLRVNTTAGDEMRLWLTRRISQLLWLVLVRRLEANPQLVAHVTAETRKSVIALKHKDALDKADFSKPYEAKPRGLPLGEAPILIVKLRVATPKAGVHALTLFPKEGQSITLTLPDRAIHSLCHLLEKLVQKAQWGFNLKLDDPALEAPPPGTRLM